jgi:hypothetical protein
MTGLAWRRFAPISEFQYQYHKVKRIRPNQRMDISKLIEPSRVSLNEHPVYAAVTTLDDLRCFMEHHIFSVWDFMSLIKHLQAAVAPARTPWRPLGDPATRRFINELVLEEESDRDWPGDESSGFCSHFELYLKAMDEIGANPAVCLDFLDQVSSDGVDRALDESPIPPASRQFTRVTFDFIQSGKNHEVAAALAVGREHVIPTIFRAILERFGISAEQAPVFHYYLNRHVHLDEDFHAPMSIRLMESLCGGDTVKQAQAADAGRRALAARLEFWDGVLESIQGRPHHSVAI